MRLLRPAILAALLLLCPTVTTAAPPAPNSEYAKSTLVVYNQTSPESRKLAAFYAKQRKIPLDNIVGLDCPMAETIKREIYDEKIAKPLRKYLSDQQLWELQETPKGTFAKSCKIHIIALMRGVPLRIAATPLPPTGKVDANGKPVPPVKNKQQTDEASVDSELTTLSLDKAPAKAMRQNPYFKRQDPIRLAALPAMMLVGRIDGPDWPTAQRLITDAIAAEKDGLWGNAYIDLARMDLTKGPGYKIGDDWLRNIAKGYAHTGIPTYIDKQSTRLPPEFPMGRDAILYFGWYVQNADGPFANPNFKFKRGAIACHIHSYSATTLHSTTRWWCGPLLARGAAATLGNVYEPFLTMTTHLDLFNVRLLQGYTFIEAAWMATPGVSWMNVMVGDPLYQPFLPTRGYPKTPDPEFKAMRIAVGRWRDDPVLYEKLEFAGDKMKSAKTFEAIGLRYREELKLDKAATAFAKALSMFTDDEDKLRMELYRIGLMRSAGKKKEAVAELRKILPKYKDKPGAKAIQSVINQLDPPPPPPPPPAKR